MPSITRPLAAFVKVDREETARQYDEWCASHRCDPRAVAAGCCGACESWLDELHHAPEIAEYAKAYEWLHEQALEEHLRRDRAEQERAALASGTASPVPPI